MFINVIKSYRDVVAVCDGDLIGKKFEGFVGGAEAQLDVKENFYKGEEVSEERVLEILRDMALEDATFNIVGSRAVELAIEAGVISEESVGEIDGVRFALVLV